MKHGLIADREYFGWIETRVRTRSSGGIAATLEHLVRRSVEIKAEVVGEDEREAGRRAILNAGHTVAHALEQATGLRLPHGEAVGLGLVAEAALATGLGLATPEAGARLAALLEQLGLPTRVREPIGAERIIAAMASDKKNRAGADPFRAAARPGSDGSGAASGPLRPRSRRSGLPFGPFHKSQRLQQLALSTLGGGRGKSGLRVDKVTNRLSTNNL